MRRPPWFVRICAPLASLAGSLCRFFALDVGPPGRIETGGLIVEPNVSLLGQPIATVRSEHPALYPAGLGLLALSAVLWLWDAGTSK